MPVGTSAPQALVARDFTAEALQTAARFLLGSSSPPFHGSVDVVVVFVVLGVEAGHTHVVIVVESFAASAMDVRIMQLCVTHLARVCGSNGLSKKCTGHDRTERDSQPDRSNASGLY